MRSNLNYKTNNEKLVLNGGALPCARLACANSSDGVTKEPHSSPQHYELNAYTACAGAYKSIGLQAILNVNAANKLGGSRCADLIAPPKSVSSLFDGIAQNKAHTLIFSKGREGGKNFTRLVY